MHDKIVDFIENHRKLCIFLLFLTIFIVGIFSLRAYNMSRKAKQEDKQVEKNVQDKQTTSDSATSEVTPTVAPTESYNSSLTIEAQQRKEEEEREKARLDEYERREAKEAEEKRVREARKNMKPTYGDAVICWDSDGVPDTMVDGSSCRAYLNSVSLSDFGSKWGKKLNTKDKFTTEFYMVGVDQNPKDTVNAVDCQSLGYLISNINKWGSNAVIKFTDLNTIGSLSDDHVAILCSYDWYSAFGMQDTLLVFEDISGTLKKSDFKSGTIFSAMIYKHNIKVKHVNGQNVVCVQYNKFK